MVYYKVMQLSVDLKPGEKEVEVLKGSLYAERLWAFYGLPFGTIFGLCGVFFLKSTILQLLSFLVLTYIWSWSLYRWLLWYFTNYIVTNKRLICIEQSGIFKKEVKELQLDRILDITYEQIGMAANMAHYGTLHVIGIGLTLDLHDVKHPSDARDLILVARPKNSKVTSEEVVRMITKDNE